MATKTRPFKSLFPGTCFSCGRRFPEGTRVVYRKFDDDFELTEEDCSEYNEIPSEAEQKEAREKMCQQCFMVHAGECL